MFLRKGSNKISLIAAKEMHLKLTWHVFLLLYTSVD